jgi:hypothetical protein
VEPLQDFSATGEELESLADRLDAISNVHDGDIVDDEALSLASELLREVAARMEPQKAAEARRLARRLFRDEPGKRGRAVELDERKRQPSARRGLVPKSSQALAEWLFRD